MLLGCDARPCTYPDIGCNLGSVAGLAAAHGATAECFETYPLWVSAVRLHGLAQRLRLAPEVYRNAVMDDKGAGGDLDFDATFLAVWPGSSIRSTKTTRRRRPRRVDPLSGNHTVRDSAQNILASTTAASRANNKRKHKRRRVHTGKRASRHASKKARDGACAAANLTNFC